MISYKTYKLLNEHFGPMALGIKTPPSVGVVGDMVPSMKDDMGGDDMGHPEDLDSMGGEEGVEDMASDSLDDDLGDKGSVVHHHHHYHITMPDTNKDGGDDMGFSPFGDKSKDMLSLAGIGGEEDGMGDEMGDEMGDDLGDADMDDSGLGDDNDMDDSSDFDADDMGDDDADDMDNGMDLEDSDDDSSDFDADDMGDDDADDESEEKPAPKAKEKPKAPKKDDSEESSDEEKNEARKSKKHMKKCNEHDDFMATLLNNSKGEMHRKKKVKFSEDSVIAPTNPNVGLGDIKPGETGFAPKGKIGEGQSSVKADYFGYTSIEDMTVAEYRVWKKNGGKLVENKKPRK